MNSGATDIRFWTMGKLLEELASSRQHQQGVSRCSSDWESRVCIASHALKLEHTPGDATTQQSDTLQLYYSFYVVPCLICSSAQRMQISSGVKYTSCHDAALSCITWRQLQMHCRQTQFDSTCSKSDQRTQK